MASSDAELVARARQGDRAAYGELAGRHADRIARFLASMTNDHAAVEDLLQESLRLGCERLAQLDDAARFGPWLLSIAANRCRNHLRDSVQRRAVGGEPAAPEAVDPRRRSALSSIVARESAELLALAIDRLPILLREAFVLLHLEDLPYTEIAGITGTSVNTLHVRVHRARALLRQQLGNVVDTFWQRPRD